MAQLRQHAAELEALNTQVVVISFGPAHLARLWQTETGAPFPLLLDLERRAYRAYGLEHSLRRAWGPRVWWGYARLLLAGRRWRGMQGDSGQLGGDVIVDGNGIVRLAHRSHDPTDRPPVKFLLDAIEQLE
ncbi:MAG: redoxin domain-containing protein [Chloroflexi bacterium]|nr:redoxin domain-containing protein [Chloroflexota bacterium]